MMVEQKSEINDLIRLVEHDIGRITNIKGGIESRLLQIKMGGIALYGSLFIPGILLNLSLNQYLGMLLIIPLVWFLYYLIWSLSAYKFLSPIKSAILRQIPDEEINRRIKETRYFTPLAMLPKTMFLIVLCCLIVVAIIPSITESQVNVLAYNSALWWMTVIISIWLLIGAVGFEKIFSKGEIPLQGKKIGGKEIGLDYIKGIPQTRISRGYCISYIFSILLALVPLLSMVFLVVGLWNRFNLGMQHVSIVFFVQLVTSHLSKMHSLKVAVLRKYNDLEIALSNLRREITSEGADYQKLKAKYDSLNTQEIIS
jgi:hypothetical protein